MDGYEDDMFDAARRGVWVIVRCFGGEAKRVRVWQENADVVWVMSDKEYRKRSDELSALWPVGFYRRAVFIDDADFFDEYGYDMPSQLFWDGLKPFSRARSAASTAATLAPAPAATERSPHRSVC